MTRLLAITLALIIGAPNCWCCLLKTAPVAVPHDCCMAVVDASKDCPLDQGSTQKKNSKDGDCSCDLSKTKREMGHAPLSLPAPTFVIATPVETDLAIQFATTFSATHWLIDDGPPHERPSIFARNCPLLL